MGAENLDRIALRRKPKQERSIQRLDLILNAAATIIAEKGVSAMRMTELAAAAKVPIGSVYQYFPEKAAIVKALFDRHAQAIQQKTTEMFEDVQSFDEALDLIATMIDWYYAEYRNDAAYLGVWMGTETDQDLLRLNIEHSGQVAEIFQAAVRRLAPESCDEQMKARTYLFSHLIGAAIRLAVLSEDSFGERILEEWKRAIRASLFAPTSASAA
ncbi:AcrR family transcriptional regulator [Rhizobium sp. BK529]|uniref:TetR/AcrR family transcriptional regulator n=1 Tax=unclassified Rhizobium TaxID=2613769 RepID=UPI0010E25DC7|nr:MULTISPECIES: TetR/AcrR family transcriptional regulator [unclassified Rhizobium]MBB3592379.1 AcrR family transcriptional regulator [Rhizobium sp. BK529]TCS06799.1 TetR family transcriptional regulator [Rhizobium sp. BK418]